MDAQLLNELIENPEKATIEQALLVHELVVKYPYFQSARVLHLKLLSLSDYPAFLKELPSVAVYAGDRKKLYHYLNPEKNKLQPVAEETTPKKAEIVESQNVKPAKQNEVYDELSMVDEGESQKFNEKGPLDAHSETLSFAQWLESMASQGGAIEAKKEELENEKTAPNNPIKEEQSNKEITPEKRSALSGLSDERWSLIDSFLKEYKPSVPKPEVDLLPPKQEVVDLSSEKQEPEKEIITETLAEIFLAQKNYNKAIEIFEKLRLKYPEKNTYFADLIKKAKKQRKKDNKKTK